MDESESSMMLAALSLSSHQDKDKSDTITRLLEEIVALKIEVEKLKEENNSLKKIREELDNELHTLTENLFEVSNST
jgi:FtsZ-binding cell division protein ZapB